MLKIIISVVYLVLSFAALAERSQYLDLNAFLNPKTENFNDIAYLHVTPQYEETPDPKKAVTIEYYFGEYEDTPKGRQRLAYIQSILQEDKRLNPKHSLELIGVSPQTDTLVHSKDFQSFKSKLKISDHKTHLQTLPNFLDYNAKLKAKKNPIRLPSSIMNARKFWTLVRFTSVMGGTGASLYFLEGVAAPMAATIAFWPGLVSGGVTYHLNLYGKWVTNGKWSKWLLESDNFFTRRIRKIFKINALTLQEGLVRNRDHFKADYPKIYDRHKNIFEEAFTKKAALDVVDSKNGIRKILGKLTNIEEYLKWWLTEVIFTGAVIKFPQAVAGVGTMGSATAMMNEVLFASSMGMLAQGPADIAIQVRKYQKIDELLLNINAGRVQFHDQDKLVDEIKKVLSREGSHMIHDGSHPALVKIENWAASRSTILAFFQVTGVGLEVAGVPAARPLLFTMGTLGGIYYANVQGWITPKKITTKIKEYIHLASGKGALLPRRSVDIRFCQSAFIPTPIK